MKKILPFAAALMMPALAFAQISNATDLGNKFNSIVQGIIIPVLITFSVLYIIYEVVRYVIADGEEDKKKASQKVAWGILGLFIILSIWGLVNILTNTFNTSNTVPTDKFPKPIPINNP